MKRKNNNMIVQIYGRPVNVMLLLLMLLFHSSCSKYLDKKPVKSVTVPDKLDDLQAVLDNHIALNEASPSLLDLVADDYYVTTAEWQANTRELLHLNYVWAAEATHYNSWLQPYIGPVYYSNIVLDQLPAVSFPEADSAKYNSIKGGALFHRAFAFHQIAQLYCAPFASRTLTEPGIVLRRTSTVGNDSKRATVQETYDQIVNDLKKAASLLPERAQYPTRPDKVAAWAALARVFLSMRNYDQAGLYADSCLQEFDSLINYNSLLPADNAPFKRFNKETIFYSHPAATNIFTAALIDTSLYQSYVTDDLRKEIFFTTNADGSHGFRGGYDGNFLPWSTFDGIATDEVFLVRAECHARRGNMTPALADLNKLLETRWRAGAFVPFTAADAAEALELILRERRKELLYRGLRWSDLRRFNEEGRNITLTRIIDGVTYQLPPRDPRWVMLIPWEVIRLSGISQNPR